MLTPQASGSESLQLGEVVSPYGPEAKPCLLTGWPAPFPVMRQRDLRYLGAYHLNRRSIPKIGLDHLGMILDKIWRSFCYLYPKV